MLHESDIFIILNGHKLVQTWLSIFLMPTVISYHSIYICHQLYLKKSSSLTSQCARGKSFTVQKPKDYSKIFNGKKLFKKCNPPDFKFYLGKLNNKNFPHLV